MNKKGVFCLLIQPKSGIINDIFKKGTASAVNTLIQFANISLHPRQGDFYIDQWKPAHKAIITHAHDDHVRAGSSSFYALQNT